MNKKFIFNSLKLCIRLNHTEAWIKPNGHDTGIKIYNCVTRTKEPLILQRKNTLKWYTCGPTVYDYSHIGHASSYVRQDIIKRILKEHFDINLVTVMNITDVDDKIIKKSIESNLTIEEISKFYEKEFWNCLNLLSIQKPDVVLRVSENMSLIIDFIKSLIDLKLGYELDGSVYFDLENYKYTYGKLQNIGNDVKVKSEGLSKKSAGDFALWKKAKEGEPFWESPWGAGRPGWHIECSALATHALGSSVDIHSGGLDLRFPHHENEEAQCCGYHKKPQWANYWLHTGILHLKHKEKMSKSLKNTIQIQDFLKTFNKSTFRIAMLTSHYRSNVEFCQEYMKNSANLLNNYKNFLNTCNDYKKGRFKATLNHDILNKLLLHSSDNIKTYLADDFDTPKTIKELNKILSITNSMLNSTCSSYNSEDLGSIASISNYFESILKSFGIDLLEEIQSSSEDFIDVLDIFTDFRQNIRNVAIETKNKKLLEHCDSVRNNLKRFGITIKDLGRTSSWSK